MCLFFFKQKTAYEMRISDWSSDVCSSDLSVLALFHNGGLMIGCIGPLVAGIPTHIERWFSLSRFWPRVRETGATVIDPIGTMVTLICQQPEGPGDRDHNVRVSIGVLGQVPATVATRSEEHTSELQSLMRT